MAAAQTKKKAAENVFKSATAAEEVMSANVGSAEPCSSLPKPTSVARAVNRHRSKNRPKQFLCGDVHKNGTRHLIFVTDVQLELLSNAKTWYVKVIKQPFSQLFSIHAFVKKDGELMQAPLAFVVISRRRRKDYKRVLRVLIAALPGRPRVQVVVSDFEAAVWSAAREVLPGVVPVSYTHLTLPTTPYV